jgi:hypothetical protein
MNDPLKIKLEKALALYLAAVLDDPELSIFMRHEKAPEVTFPHLIIAAEDSQQAEGMPRETAIRTVRVRLQVAVDSEDEADSNRERIDPWLYAIEGAMEDVSAMQEAINPPATLPDDRAVIDLHVYDCQFSSEPSDFQGTKWVEERQFEIICQPYDALTGIEEEEPEDPEPDIEEDGDDA